MFELCTEAMETEPQRLACLLDWERSSSDGRLREDSEWARSRSWTDPGLDELLGEGEERLGLGIL